MTSVKPQEWQIGDVRILRVIESEVAIPPQFMFGDCKLDIVERAPWLQPDFVQADGRLITSIHAFIIDDGTHRMIVDTCIGNDKARVVPFWNGLQGPFLQNLAEAGYPAESIDRVLCTHMHVDHVGWNTRLEGGRWVPTFPNARYLFGRTEWEHWSAEAPEPGEDIIGDSVRPIFEHGLADLVESDHRVSETVWLEPTPGHTPGHVSVRIGSRGEEAVVTGDLMHHPLQIADPDICATFDVDSDWARKTRCEFLDRYTNRAVLVLGTHFATPTGGRIVKDAGGRRLVVGA